MAKWLPIRLASLDRSLSVDVVQELAARRSLKGSLIHSDQGIHYTNREYHQLLKSKSIIQSMSRKGNCWDNAMAENFFSHLKYECVRLVKRSFRSFLDVVEAVEGYIRFYNEERPQLRLNGLSPVTFRQQSVIFDPVNGLGAVYAFGEQSKPSPCIQI